MINPLTSLDELILKQYEKVTVKANKELGWSKYDLARLSTDYAATLYVGTGIYFFMGGFPYTK